jgi:hypothetical protein
MLKPPFQFFIKFTTPTVGGDTPEKHARYRHEFKAILREAKRYLGVEELRQIVDAVTIGRRGKRADKERNEGLLAAWKAKDPRVEKRKFCRTFYETHLGERSPEAVEKRLDRLLEALQKQDEAQRHRALQELRRPSDGEVTVIGDALGNALGNTDSDPDSSEGVVRAKSDGERT